MKMYATRTLLVLCAVLGALILLGAVIGDGPVIAPLVVGLGLVGVGPATAALRRRRVHAELAARADQARVP